MCIAAQIRQVPRHLYVGDSPNDEPMFAFFPNAVGVATVLQYADRMATRPWARRGGFVEVADALLGPKNRPR